MKSLPTGKVEGRQVYSCMAGLYSSIIHGCTKLKNLCSDGFMNVDASTEVGIEERKLQEK